MDIKKHLTVRDLCRAILVIFLVCDIEYIASRIPHLDVRT